MVVSFLKCLAFAGTMSADAAPQGPEDAAPQGPADAAPRLQTLQVKRVQQPHMCCLNSWIV